MKAPRLIILVTGSRHWSDSDAVELAMKEAVGDLSFNQVALVHGDCATGADRIAAEAAKSFGVAHIIAMPADWSQGKSAGPKRNEAMCQWVASQGIKAMCLAFWDAQSRGTAHCISCAVAHGIRVLITPERK